MGSEFSHSLTGEKKNHLIPSLDWGYQRWLVKSEGVLKNPRLDSFNSYSGWWFGTFFTFPYSGNNHPNCPSCCLNPLLWKGFSTVPRLENRTVCGAGMPPSTGPRMALHLNPWVSWRFPFCHGGTPIFDPKFDFFSVETYCDLGIHHLKNALSIHLDCKIPSHPF